MWNNGGMKLTGENRNTRRKTRPSSTLSTTNLMLTRPGSKPDFRGEGRQLQLTAIIHKYSVPTLQKTNCFFRDQTVSVVLNITATEPKHVGATVGILIVLNIPMIL
jgi:hypothetical protein